MKTKQKPDNEGIMEQKKCEKNQMDFTTADDWTKDDAKNKDG